MQLPGTLLLGAYFVVAAAQPGPELQALKNPFADRPEAAEEGKKRFQDACASCHGANVEGGRGPNLAENESLRAMKDDRIFITIRQGIPGTNMPPFSLPDDEIWRLVSFLRSLSTPAFFTPQAGNAEAGRTLFHSAGCDSCHSIRGKGGSLGPDLTNVAGTRTATQLRDSVLHPNAHRVSGFTGVSVVCNDGRTVQGIAKNNSNYSIQVLDTEGYLHLFEKSMLKSVEFRKNSIMPDNYGTQFSAAQFSDLLAFLTKQAIRTDLDRNTRDEDSERR